MNNVTFQKAPASSQPGTVTARQDTPAQALSWVQWGNIQGNIAVQYDLQAALDGKVSNAPMDGKQYGRQDGAWTEITSLQDAPETGTAYGRQDAAWEPVVALAGDQMLGPLLLSGTPTEPFEAAPKQYVDAVATNLAGLSDTVDDLAAEIVGLESAVALNTADIAGKEPAIAGGAATDYWTGAKTWADFAGAVRSTTLTGLNNAAAPDPVSATDTLLTAFGKVLAWSKITATKTSGTGALNVPAGADISRPTIPNAGQFRFNTTSSVFEGWNGSAWNPLGVSGAANWGSITGVLSTQTDLQTALNGKVNKSGDQMTGNLAIQAPALASAFITLIKPSSSGFDSAIYGSMAGAARWGVLLGDNSTENILNVGSDFAIHRYDDAGAFIDKIVSINRSTGSLKIGTGQQNITLGGAKAASLQLSKKDGAAGSQNNITGTTNGAIRWNIRIGDAAQETGANAGSNFVVARYDDGGNTLGDVLTAVRATGATTIQSDAATKDTLTLIGGGTQGANLVLHNTGWGSRSLRVNATGQLTFINAAYNTETHSFDNGGSMTIINQAYKPGGGVWADSSDERVKDNIEDYTAGLAEILALRPKKWNFKAETGRDTSITYYGLIAQGAEGPMPEMVKSGPGKLGSIELPDLRTMDATPIPFALVNAVHELQAQIDALHARIAALEAA